MAIRVKSYIDLEIANESRKTHKESKKETHEEKRSEQYPHVMGMKIQSVATYYHTLTMKTMRLSPLSIKKFHWS